MFGVIHAASPDERLAEQIREDRNRYSYRPHDACRREPAPSPSLAKPATRPSHLSRLLPAPTGLQTIDYRLSDPYFDPIGIDESLYSETNASFYPAHVVVPIPSRPKAPAPSLRPPGRKPPGNLTFGCLNSFTKVTPEIMSLWVEVLKTVTTSSAPDPSQPAWRPPRSHSSPLRHLGIAPNRIEFIGHLPLPEYFRGRTRKSTSASTTYPLGPAGANHLRRPLDGRPRRHPRRRDRRLPPGGLSVLSNIGLADLAATRPETLHRHLATSLALPPPLVTPNHDARPNARLRP